MFDCSLDAAWLSSNGLLYCNIAGNRSGSNNESINWETISLCSLFFFDSGKNSVLAAALHVPIWRWRAYWVVGLIDFQDKLLIDLHVLFSCVLLRLIRPRCSVCAVVARSPSTNCLMLSRGCWIRFDIQCEIHIIFSVCLVVVYIYYSRSTVNKNKNCTQTT